MKKDIDKDQRSKIELLLDNIRIMDDLLPTIIEKHKFNGEQSFIDILTFIAEMDETHVFYPYIKTQIENLKKKIVDCINSTPPDSDCRKTVATFYRRSYQMLIESSNDSIISNENKNLERKKLKFIRDEILHVEDNIVRLLNELESNMSIGKLTKCIDYIITLKEQEPLRDSYVKKVYKTAIGRLKGLLETIEGKKALSVILLDRYIVYNDEDISSIFREFLFENDLLNPEFIKENLHLFREYLSSKTAKEIYECTQQRKLDEDVAGIIIGRDKCLELYRENPKKNRFYLSLIPTSDMIALFKNGELKIEEIEKSNLLKIKNEIIELLSIGKLKQSDLLELLQAGFPLLIKKEEVLDLYENNIFTNEQMLQLAMITDAVEINTIADIYNRQNDTEISEICKEDFGYISEEEIKQYLTLEKLLVLRSSGKLSDAILVAYKRISYGANDLKRLNVDIKTCMELYNLGIISTSVLIETTDTKELLEHIDGNNEVLFELYNSGKLDLDELVIHVEENELFLACKEGKIDLSVLTIFLQEEIIENFKEQRLSINQMINLFEMEIIDLDGFRGLELDSETIVKNLGDEISEETLQKLFIARIIGYNDFYQLYKEGKISEEAFYVACEKYEVSAALEEIEKRQKIINDGTPESKHYMTARNQEELGERRRASVNPDLRIAFLEQLGCTHTIPIVSGALRGYDFHAIPEQHIVVLEKTHNPSGSEAVGNATYVLPIIRAIELAETSNKQKLREECRYVYHTRNWPIRMLQVISEAYKRFEHEKYLQQHPDIQDLIENIQMDYDENTEDVR